MLLYAVGVIVVLLLVAAVIVPAKSKPSVTPLIGATESLRPQSLRQQFLAEDSNALAAEFARKKQEQYVSELCSEAAGFFGGTAPKAAK